MGLIKKLNLKAAGCINIAALATTIVVHCLVIFKVLPFTWLNGGRSATFESGMQTSIISIGILFLMILINLFACEVIRVNKFAAVLKMLLWVLLIYSIFALAQQLLGTPFEKFVMSILCLVNVLMYLRMAVEKRTQT